MKKRDSRLIEFGLPVGVGLLVFGLIQAVLPGAPTKKQSAAPAAGTPDLGSVYRLDEHGRHYRAFVKKDDKRLICYYPGDLPDWIANSTADAGYAQHIICDLKEFVDRFEKKFGKLDANTALLKIEKLCEESGLPEDLQQVRDLIAARKINFELLEGKEGFIAHKCLGYIEFTGTDEYHYQIMFLTSLEFFCGRKKTLDGNITEITLEDALRACYDAETDKSEFTEAVGGFANNIEQVGAVEAANRLRSLMNSDFVRSPKSKPMSIGPIDWLRRQNTGRMA